MQQPQLDREKAVIMLLFVVLALSSLGFAIYSLVLGPELTLDHQWHRTEQVPIVRPNVPDLDRYREFWQDAGYLIIQRDQNYEVQSNPRLAGGEVWVQGRERWTLLPQRHDLTLSALIFELFDEFLDEGWLMQIESTTHGYSIGFLSSLQEDNVLGLLWEIELLNPHNYGYHMGGLISIMGDFFDPQGVQRGTPEAPVLALIIDDWGYFTPAIEPMIAYPFPLTIAVLPHLDMSWEISELAAELGHEVILHQPMQAHSRVDMGPGGITVNMDPSEIERILRENVATLPAAVGLNNHMGSLVTEDSEVMTNVLQVVKELGLFFVDSRTSSQSVVGETAVRVGVPHGDNNLFIDNESDVESIKTQLRTALQLAQQKGHAVAIGHVRPNTVDALWEMIPEFLDSGVLLAPVSSLLENQ